MLNIEGGFREEGGCWAELPRRCIAAPVYEFDKATPMPNWNSPTSDFLRRLFTHFRPSLY